MTDTINSEASRLEQLWAGEFGDAYIRRNRQAGAGREIFWRKLLAAFPVTSALEVGCNVGANLRWIAESVPPQQVYGVDINPHAIEEVRLLLPQSNTLLSPARSLPFRDRWFDLVFTMGVLIHQPETSLPLVMSEMVRTSRRYILCGEYFADEPQEIPYREQQGALFKRDYGRLYRELFPELRLVEQGHLEGPAWDNLTWWLFEIR